MSDKHRILIVDDHKEIRTTFRANLEALDAEVEVIDVPSGEEAILEAIGQPLDLMIADVGLPGLSGLELLEKIKVHNPEMKIILITGLEDEDIRRKVADAGTDAFFLKPVKIPDLLKAVRRCLGLKGEHSEGEDLQPLPVEPMGEEITERVADLRGELGAISIVLLSRQKKIVAQSGGWPDAVYEYQVIPQLMNMFQNVNQISSFLRLNQPQSSWYFSGAKYDLFWTHVGAAHALLVITNPVAQNTDLTWVLSTIDLAAKETLKMVQKWEPKFGDIRSEPDAVEEEQQEKVESKPSDKEIERGDKSEEPPSDFVELKPGLTSEDAKSFWESATLEDDEVENPDVLTYEQAQKLGFIPEGNDVGG